MIHFLFPPECLVCSKTGSLLCQKCQKDLKPTLPSCYVCKKLSNNFATHPGCLKNSSLEKVVTFFKYNECSKRLIHNFKYKDRFKVADFLFSLFEYKLQSMDFKNSMLIPLPSHRSKMLERGFNPTEILCQLISRKTGILVNTKLVIKKISNASQASLEYTKRRENVRDVFEVNSQELLNIEKRIIIVDDIITTGSTLDEIARVIKEASKDNLQIEGVCIFQGSFRKKAKSLPQ